MLILTQKEIQKILPPKDIKKVIEVVEKAFFDYFQGKVQMPAKLYLNFKKYHGDLRIMPSFSETLEMAGTKLVNVHPENPKKGLKTVMAVIVLNDPKTGLPLALMDGTWITALRTGSASAVATKYLAKKKARIMGVIGAGFQAFTQILAILKVRKIKEILVFDIIQKKVENLNKALRGLKIKIKKVNLPEEASKVDILVTITPSRKPIVKREWILPGTHINAIGADACYDAETEIMTPNGFIPVAKLQEDMEVWSLNPITRCLEIAKVIKMHKYNYKGKMIRARTLYTDFLVTPNHNIPNFSRDGKRFLGFVKASDLANRWRTVTTVKASWKGKNEKIFSLPRIKKTNNYQKEYSFKMEDWMEFLGWYISEGSLKDQTSSIIISQKDKRKSEKIRNLLTRMGLRSSKTKNDWTFSSKQIYEYLKNKVGKYRYKKRIPREFLELDKKYLLCLFNSLIDGDGWRRKTKSGKERYAYSTSSKDLVDDVIELALKLGRFCTLSFEGKGRLSKGGFENRKVNPIHPIWIIQIGADDGYNTRSVFKKNLKYEEKNSLVACPELDKNHILIIRRNGRITLNGNSGKEELDPEILKRAKIVIDNWEQASHSGEINVPLAKGIIKKEDIYGELSEIVSHKKPARQNDEEITIFDSTGLAIQDLYTGALIYRLAQKKKIGREIKIFE